jgi:hypothetical protein
MFPGRRPLIQLWAVALAVLVSRTSEDPGDLDGPGRRVDPDGPGDLEGFRWPGWWTRLNRGTLGRSWWPWWMGRIPVLGVVLGSGCHDAIDAIDVPYLVQRDVVVHAIGWQVTSGYGNSSLYRKPAPLRPYAPKRDPRTPMTTAQDRLKRPSSTDRSTWPAASKTPAQDRLQRPTLAPASKSADRSPGPAAEKETNSIPSEKKHWKGKPKKTGQASKKWLVLLFFLYFRAEKKLKRKGLK